MARDPNQVAYVQAGQKAGTWAREGMGSSGRNMYNADPVFGNLAKGEAIAKRAKDFGYGTNNSAAANADIARSDAIGQQYGGAFNGMASANQGRAEAADARGTAGYMGDTGRYNQGLNNAQDARAKQGSSYDALNKFANEGPGPSAAQAQLTQATDANTQNALAMARSGRGMGGGQAAMRSALGQNANTQQTAASQMAQLRANENTAYQGQKLQALNAAGSMATGIAGSDQAYAAQGLEGAKYATDTKLKGTQLNDATAQGWAGQQANATSAAMGAEMGAETQKQNINASALAGRENEYASANSTYATEKGLAQAASIADANRNQAYTGAAVNAVATGLGALSDERAKKNIRPLSTWGTGDDDPVLADAFAQGVKAGAGALEPGKVRSTWGTGDDEYASALVERAKRADPVPRSEIKDPGSAFDPISHSDMVRGEDADYSFGDSRGKAEYWAPAKRGTGPHESINPENNPYLLSDERSKQDINPLGTPPAVSTLGVLAPPTNSPKEQPDGSVAGKVGGPSLAQQQAAQDEKKGQTGGMVGKTAGNVVGGVAGGAIGGPVGAAAGSFIGGAIGSLAGKTIGKALSDERSKQNISPLGTPATVEGPSLDKPEDKGPSAKETGKDIGKLGGQLEAIGQANAAAGVNQSMAIASKGQPGIITPERYTTPLSDIHSKHDVEPIDFSAEIAKRYPGIAKSSEAVARYADASPKQAARMAKNNRPILSEGDSLLGGSEPGGPLAQSAREIPGYAYDYKHPGEPGAKPGRQVGPMAQDLAANPLTRGTVVKDGKGKLGVDTPRLTLYNTAAQHAQQSQLDSLNSKIDSLAGLLKRKPSDARATDYGGFNRGTAGL